MTTKSKQQIIADILEISVEELEENVQTITIPECWRAMEEFALATNTHGQLILNV